jgi:hypothetical protein
MANWKWRVTAAECLVLSHVKISGNRYSLPHQVFLSTGSEVEGVLGVRGGLTAGQRRVKLSHLKKHAEYHVLQDATLTVADRAVKLGVSKRTLQRRLAATRCAA